QRRGDSARARDAAVHRRPARVHAAVRIGIDRGDGSAVGRARVSAGARCALPRSRARDLVRGGVRVHAAWTGLGLSARRTVVLIDRRNYLTVTFHLIGTVSGGKQTL